MVRSARRPAIEDDTETLAVDVVERPSRTTALADPPILSRVRAAVSREDAFERYFPYFLCAVTIAALVPSLVVGVTKSMTIDGYWNVFIATQDRWSMFLSENQHDEHPMLYRLLLRMVAHLGSSRLTYRSLSIIPGLATIYAIGLVASRVCLRKSVALLAAIAYGFSATIIDIMCEVRGYSLALFFIVAAFYQLVRFLDGGSLLRRKRSLLWFGAMASLAIGTEFYSVLFLSSCVAFFLSMFLRHSQFRRDVLRWTLVRGHPLVVAFGVPAAVALGLYFGHERNKLFPHVYLAQFYWTRNDPVIPFVLRNLRNEFDFMAPVGISSMLLVVILVAGVVLAALYFSCVRANQTKTLIATTPALILVFLLAQLILLSLWRRYPFGGELRHQSIIFPFVTLAAFVALDRMVAFLPYDGWRIGTVGLAALLTISILYLHWTPRVYEEEGYSPEFRAFQSNFSSTPAIYVDQFSLLNYYSQTSALKWRFLQHYHAREAIDAYQVRSANGQVELLRDLDQFDFDLGSPTFYTSLRQVISETRLGTVTLFFVNSRWRHQNPPEQTVRRLADDAGLTVGAVLRSDSETFAAFSLR